MTTLSVTSTNLVVEASSRPKRGMTYSIRSPFPTATLGQQLRQTLLLFTGSYPFAVAAENSFLPQEIEVLARSFESVILIPTATGGARETINASNVTVDTS